ncbi:hypothetical protein ARMGADRAFT_1033762 [Armillaria gallica]|uniref:Uncharacterized protein n=1 Tax=Armillaria gallica TaxID=47427 RepID=A0A2H3D0J3_ARMGA|nr:hypothetical protein ARMGADRAFT_1033762 [Armillaria gallica]
MTTPVVCQCLDDYPEQVLLAGIVQGWCAKSLYQYLFITVLKSDQPFTFNFSWVDIHEILLSDLLHQIIKGSFKDHLVEWVYLAAVTEYLLEAIMKSHSAFMDFCYLIQQSNFDKSTLTQVRETIQQFHYFCKAFKLSGVHDLIQHGLVKPVWAPPPDPFKTGMEDEGAVDKERMIEEVTLVKTSECGYPRDLTDLATATFYSPSDISSIQGMRYEHIHTTPSWHGYPQYDCALAVVNQHKPGFCNMNAVHNGDEFPCTLVHWFNTYRCSPDPKTRLWIVQPDSHGVTTWHTPILSVIHVDTLLHDCFEAFYINYYADYHMHEIVF